MQEGGGERRGKSDVTESDKEGSRDNEDDE